MHNLRYGLALALAIGLAGAAGACGVGDVASPSLSGAPSPGGSSVGPGTDGGPSNTNCIPPACKDVALPTSAHAIRLTNAQWELTTRDLLKLPVASGLSMSFPQDSVGSVTTTAKFGGDASNLEVAGDGWQAYQSAAEQLAALVTGDAGMTAALLPPGATGGDVTANVAAFVADFLPRAYRRPVTADEISGVIAAAESAAQLATTGDPFLVRMQWVITTVLQSPKFLYQINFGEDTVTSGRARLTAYELLSKLSFGLWGTMPDDAFTGRAKAGELATNDGVAKVAGDMLQDPRAQANIAAFHDLLYAVNDLPNTVQNHRDLTAFPSYYPEFVADAQQDVRLSVQEIVVTENGGKKDLDTSTVAFVNTRLAPIYGIDPATIPELASAAGPDVFVKIHMDPAKRKGILMHPAWLALEGTAAEPSPIHRGVYLTRHALCLPLGNPPAAAMGANPDAAPGNTNRDRVVATTKGCGDGCHGGVGGVINPLGFAFEGFDSIGMVRANDNGYPIDTTGTIAALGPFSGATPLFDALSTNAQAHACYAAHWAAYLTATSTVDVTPRWLSPVIAKSMNNGSVRDVVVALVQTDAFLTVSRQ